MENLDENDQNMLALAQSFITLLDAVQDLICQGTLSLDKLEPVNNKVWIPPSACALLHFPQKDEFSISSRSRTAFNAALTDLRKLCLTLTPPKSESSPF